jgi:hypothetical protein
MTVQAPQSPEAQPSLVPVNPLARKYCKAVLSAGALTSTVCWLMTNFKS